jgi:predicted RNA-binding Zn-ribbon protein involved in translation (DUF1610 family)
MEGLLKFPCPVCGEKDVIPAVATRGDFKECSCPTCGRFDITGAAQSVVTRWGNEWRADLRDLTEQWRLRAGLSAFIRQANKSGTTPTLTGNMDLSGIADSYCHTSVATKLRRVMEQYEELTREPGQWVRMDTEHDYPLCDAALQA